MNSLICNFIQQHNDWRERLEALHIRIVEEDIYALFKYNMDADFSNPIVQEARGIIVNLETFEPVCWPFRKFGNYGESYADKIDWATARVQEKLDGSIIKLWHDGKKWRMSTNGTIDAFTANNSEGYNFGTIAMFALINQREDFFTFDNHDLNPDYTYMFELISPKNQIVVQYNDTLMYHIGSRNNKTGEEANIDLGIIKPKEYKLSSLDDCITFANAYEGTDFEGFVVVDKNWNRIKIKNENYLTLHYLAGNGILPLSKAIDIVLAEEIEEFCTYFPNKRERLEEIKTKMELEVSLIKNNIEVAKEKVDAGISRKDFATLYKYHPHFHFLMQVLYGNKELDIPKKYWEKLFKD